MVYRTTAIDIVVKQFGTLFMKMKGITRTTYLSDVLEVG